MNRFNKWIARQKSCTEVASAKIIDLYYSSMLNMDFFLFTNNFLLLSIWRAVDRAQHSYAVAHRDCVELSLSTTLTVNKSS